MSTVLVAALTLATATPWFEPARLKSGSAELPPLRTRAAGLVYVELTVDSHGAVSDVRTIQDVAPLTETVRGSVSQWRFAPAREDRQAVESHVLVAGMFRPPALLFPLPEKAKSPDAQPSSAIPFPTGVAVPPYPATGFGQAVVVVEVDVSATGSVESAKALAPPTPFCDVAVAAALKWTFRPARRAGRDVPGRVYVLFGFRLPVMSSPPRRR
jgi:hypothetical protein